MRCHVCGSELVSMVTDLPFKLNETTIVILKDLPVLQCGGCSEYLLEDAVGVDPRRNLARRTRDPHVAS